MGTNRHTQTGARICIDEFRYEQAARGLDAVGIAVDARGRIPVNEDHETPAEGIHAIGDVVPGPMLAHVAEEDGIACVERRVRGAGEVDHDAAPSIVTTPPEIASVGKTEDGLKERSIPHRKGAFPLRADGRAHRLGDTEGYVAVLAHAAIDRVLGVHIPGARAGDMIAEAAAAIAFAASSEDLARAFHAHPTESESLEEAALAVEGRALRIPPAKGSTRWAAIWRTN